MTLATIGGAGGAWLIAALALGVAELAIPGVFAIFLAIAAAIVGVATLVVPLPVEAQLAGFAIWSIVTVLIGRRWYRDFPVASSDPALNDRSARMVGDTVVVEVAIDADGGRVRIGDGSWPARGAPAPAGARVRIVAVRGGLVIVEPLGA